MAKWTWMWTVEVRKHDRWVPTSEFSHLPLAKKLLSTLLGSWIDARIRRVRAAFSTGAQACGLCINCAQEALAAANEQLAKDRRHMDDLEAEIRVLRATDKNTDYAAKWRHATAVLDRVMKDCNGLTDPELSRPSAETLIAVRDLLAAQEANP